MYELIGYRDKTDDYCGAEDVVATFDKEADAWKYVEDSKLKYPRDGFAPYRVSSLLSWYNSAHVQPRSAGVPHNPKIGDK